MVYEPTHDAPAGGLPAWPTPDGTGAPAATLGAGLDVQVLERTGDWAHIVCSNGWEAWVDGRRLVDRSAPAAAPAATPSDPTPTAAPVEPVSPSEPMPAAAPVTPAPGSPSPVAPSPVGTPPARSEPAPQPTSSFAPAGAAAPAPSGYGTASRPSPTAAEPTKAPVAPAPKKKGSLGVGGILSLIAAGVVFLSTLPAWLDLGLDVNAFDTPVEYLRDNVAGVNDTITGDVGLSIGAVLLVVGVLIALGAVFRRMRLLTLAGGVLALVIAVDHLYQSWKFAQDSEGTVPEIGLGDVTGPAPFLLIVGAGLAIAGGVLAQRK